MKNLKELQPILTAVFCINRTNGQRDNDMDTLLDYAYRRFYGANTNLLSLACIGKTKEQIMPKIMQILENATQYIQYLEDYKK